MINNKKIGSTSLNPAELIWCTIQAQVPHTNCWYKDDMNGQSKKQMKIFYMLQESKKKKVPSNLKTFIGCKAQTPEVLP